MPVLESSTFRPPFFLRNGHIQTIIPVLFRRKVPIIQERLRINTPDGDFLDVDLTQASKAAALADASDIYDSRHIAIPPRPAPPSPDKGFRPGDANPRLIVVIHGLEGNSRRNYIRAAVRVAVGLGIDALAWNFRCCSGECNRRPELYHSGETRDLAFVIAKAVEWGYRRIALVGFSMGGNQILNFLGRDSERVPQEVRAAAAFSVPCDMPGAAQKLESLECLPYMEYFMRTLKEKIKIKNKQYPDLYPIDGLEHMHTFTQFDNRYTAPVFGFESARDYWRKSSSRPHLLRIDVPTLLVNARNDPFLSESCYPFKEAEQSGMLYLETPCSGGHVGFTETLRCEVTWAEKRLGEFLAERLLEDSLSPEILSMKQPDAE